MPTPTALLAFLAMSALLIAIPGPSVLFVIGRALAHGRRTALLSVLGNTAGAFLLATAVALGVGAVVAASAVVFAVLKYAGAAYLVYLGVTAWRARRALAWKAPDKPAHRVLWEGFAVGVTNPKTAVFFAAVLPQFVSRDKGGVPLQLLMLGALFCALALVMDSGWGLMASAARGWFGRSERRMVLVGGAGGLAMIGLGVTVAVTGKD